MPGFVCCLPSRFQLSLSSRLEGIVSERSDQALNHHIPGHSWHPPPMPLAYSPVLVSAAAVAFLCSGLSPGLFRVFLPTPHVESEKILLIIFPLILSLLLLCYKPTSLLWISKPHVFLTYSPNVVQLWSGALTSEQGIPLSRMKRPSLLHDCACSFWLHCLHVNTLASL